MANPPPPPPPTQGPGWQGAPPVTKISGAGSHLWAIATSNDLYQISESHGSRGGYTWDAWSIYRDMSLPPVFEIADAFQWSGYVQSWVVDTRRQLWSLRTFRNGTTSWRGPNWNNAPTGLEGIATSQQGAGGGAALWAITEDSSLIYCFELNTPDPMWSQWQTWPATPQNSKLVEITAAQQNGGGVQFWALDTDQQLWSRSRASPTGDWSSWSPPNWEGAPSLIKIAACEQAGTRGQQLWGITEDYSLVSNFQVSVGNGWNGWSTGTWQNAPPVKEITACLAPYGCAHLWAVTLEQKLIGISQLAPGGGWGSWSPPR